MLKFVSKNFQKSPNMVTLNCQCFEVITAQFSTTRTYSVLLIQDQCEHIGVLFALYLALCLKINFAQYQKNLPKKILNFAFSKQTLKKSPDFYNLATTGHSEIKLFSFQNLEGSATTTSSCEVFHPRPRAGSSSRTSTRCSLCDLTSSER